MLVGFYVRFVPLRKLRMEEKLKEKFLGYDERRREKDEVVP